MLVDQSIYIFEPHCTRLLQGSSRQRWQFGVSTSILRELSRAATPKSVPQLSDRRIATDMNGEEPDASLPKNESIFQRVLRIDQKFVTAGNPGTAFHLRNNGVVGTETGGSNYPAGKAGAQDALDDDGFV